MLDPRNLYIFEVSVCLMSYDGPDGSLRVKWDVLLTCRIAGVFIDTACGSRILVSNTFLDNINKHGVEMRIVRQIGDKSTLIPCSVQQVSSL